MAFAAALLPITAGIMMITGGFSAAQHTCKYLAQTATVKQQTIAFISSAKLQLKNLQTTDGKLNDETNDLNIQSQTAVNLLLGMRKDYIAYMKKFQLGSIFVIIIIFMLLLGKKLKIY